MPRSLGFIRGKSGFHPRIFLDIALCQELEKRQQERDVIMAQELVRAMRKSGKTYHEVMTFLHPS